MNINNFILPVLILVTFLISLKWCKFFILLMPFGLSMFAIWYGYYGQYQSVFFVIPSIIAFITLLLLINKALNGELI